MAVTKIYVYGFSGHGAVVADVARACGYGEVVFLDDAKFDGKNVLKFDPSLEKADVIVAIGDNKIRRILQERVKNAGFVLVNLIHHFAHVSPNAALAGGVIVGANTHVGIGSCAVQCIKIGADCIIGAGSVVVRDIADGSVAYGNPAKVRRNLS